MSNINKVVLAYSGGLDTSVIVKWLMETYNCEVVTFTADIGQGEEVEPARAKAQALGVKEIYIEDLREEFVRDLSTPCSALTPFTKASICWVPQLLAPDCQTFGRDRRGNRRRRHQPWRDRQG